MKTEPEDWYTNHENSSKSSSIEFNIEWMLKNAEIVKETRQRGYNFFWNKIDGSDANHNKLRGGEKSN